MKLTRNVFGSLRGLSVLLTVCFLILGGILPSAALAVDRSAKKDPVAAEDASYTVWTYDAGKDALIADYGSSKETYTPVGKLPDRLRFVGLDFFIYADSTSHGESVRAPYYKSRYVMLGDGTGSWKSWRRELCWRICVCMPRRATTPPSARLSLRIWPMPTTAGR